MLDPVIHKTITYVQNLEEKDLKDKVSFSTRRSLRLHAVIALMRGYTLKPSL